MDRNRAPIFEFSRRLARELGAHLFMNAAPSGRIDAASTSTQLVANSAP